MMDITSSNGDNLLTHFHPKLRRQIQELLLGDKIVLSNLTLDDILPHDINNDLEHCSHFVVRIPYAGKKIDWDVYFNPEDIEFAPDFDTTDEIFSLYNIECIANNLPTWANWNINDNKCLNKLLREFMVFYKKHQIEKLERDNIYSKILTEYTEALMEGLNSENVEILVDNDVVHFLVNIIVDCSSLPEYLQMKELLENPGEDTANLRISFNRLDGSQVIPSLYLSPRLDQVLGNAKQLSLPRYCKDYTFWQYIKKVSQLLDNLVQEIEYCNQFRKDFIMFLVTTFCDKLVEYDADMFLKAEFIFEIDDFHALVTFNLDSRFPKEKPKIFVTSIYCMDKTNPCMEILDSYPYSARWKIEEMAEKMLIRVSEVMKNMATHKH